MKVELKHVTKIFPGRVRGTPNVVAVRDANFEIPDGKLVGLLGPSGCGKSTTLNLLCGLEKPTEGQILFDGEDVTGLDAHLRGIGIVFQNYALYPHLTVRKNILFPLENLKGKEKLSKAQKTEKMLAAARLVQIEELLDRRPGELSGGQQQRVAIARALIKTPNVLLLDEPLSNLDARLRLQTREEIRRIQQETRVTTVFVTHDQEEAMSISDYIVVMEKGVIRQIGKPQEVYDDPQNLFVAKFLGNPPINVFSGTVRDGKLRLGEDCLGALAAPCEDREVTVAIRPEGFVPARNGALSGSLYTVEVSGRDTSVIFSHPALSGGGRVRAIVSGRAPVAPDFSAVRFDIAPEKLFCFDPVSGDRLPLELSDGGGKHEA